MKKAKITYVCTNCGEEYMKWQGQCSNCEEWNKIEEGSSVPKVDKNEVFSHSGYAGRSGSSSIRKLSEVSSKDQMRDSTGFSELDGVMGGGVVVGSVTLIGGDPGIGKSTLLIQTISNMASKLNKRTLYVTGEESDSQIKLRAERLELDTDKIHIISETNIETILEHVRDFKPEVLIIDSIQSMFTSSSSSNPGSKKQLEDSTKILTIYSKQNNVSTFIVGHVTKDGSIAGPKVLEHIVDTVVYFEGDEDSKFRLLRSIKNRFGETGEVALFSMEEKGLLEITNPSAIFLTKHEEPISGSSLLITREGSRNLIIEVQALVNETQSDFVIRKGIGIDKDRLEMIVAVLQKKLGLKLFNQSIHVSVVGGVRIKEPAIDLAIITSLISSFYDKPLPNDLVVFGEIGLAGEVRAVKSGEERIREAIKQGLKTFIIPKGNKPESKKLLASIKKEKIKIYSIANLYELNDTLSQLF